MANTYVSFAPLTRAGGEWFGDDDLAVCPFIPLYRFNWIRVQEVEVAEFREPGAQTSRGYSFVPGFPDLVSPIWHAPRAIGGSPTPARTSPFPKHMVLDRFVFFCMSYHQVTKQELLDAMADPKLLWSPWFRIIVEKFLIPKWWDDLDGVFDDTKFQDFGSIHKVMDFAGEAVPN